jgi:hypothetical protein
MASADPPQWAIDAYALCWNKPGTAVMDTPVLAHQLDLEVPIVVRDEYYNIWKYIVRQKSRQAQQKGGLVVWGQPGIGA